MTARHRRLVNLSEGARLAGLPRTTVAGWTRGDNPRLYRQGLDAAGTALYDLARILELAAETPRRRRRATRRSK